MLVGLPILEFAGRLLENAGPEDAGTKNAGTETAGTEN